MLNLILIGNVIIVTGSCSIILQSEQFEFAVDCGLWRESKVKTKLAFFKAVYFCMGLGLLGWT